MTKQALQYGWTVVAIGAGVGVCAAMLWQPVDATSFLVCLALAVLASTVKVRLPGIDGTISPAFVFLLVAASKLSWSETVAIGVASALVQSLWRTKRRPAGFQIAFNAATMAIAGGLAYGVAHGMAAAKGGGGDPAALQLAVCGMVLLVTNTLMVSVILCLQKGTPLYTIWRSLQPHAVPYYMAGGLLASVWHHADLTGSGVALMAAVSVYLLGVCYRETAERFWRDGSDVPAAAG